MALSCPAADLSEQPLTVQTGHYSRAILCSAISEIVSGSFEPLFKVNPSVRDVHESPRIGNLWVQATRSYGRRKLGSTCVTNVNRKDTLLPARNTPHVQRWWRYALVAVDAGLLAREQITLMRDRGAWPLLFDVHGFCAMAVAAFQRTIPFEACPISCSAQQWLFLIYWRRAFIGRRSAK